MSLVDYLQEKLEAAQVGCTCPTKEFMAGLPVGCELLTDCVEHGQRRTTVGGFAYARADGIGWRRGGGWRWPWSAAR